MRKMTLKDHKADGLTARIFEAINAMMLDMLAAVARKDYEDRRRRQMQGIEKARRKGLFRGRPEDKERMRHPDAQEGSELVGDRQCYRLLKRVTA
jgi:DNA invertase Pin-like site-specific DNA recombinase